MSVSEEVRMRDSSWKIYIIRNWQRNPSSIRYMQRKREREKWIIQTQAHVHVWAEATHMHMTTYNIWIGAVCYSDHLSLLISGSVIEEEMIKHHEINRWTPAVSLSFFSVSFHSSLLYLLESKNSNITSWISKCIWSSKGKHVYLIILNWNV